MATPLPVFMRGLTSSCFKHATSSSLSAAGRGEATASSSKMTRMLHQAAKRSFSNHTRPSSTASPSPPSSSSSANTTSSLSSLLFRNGSNSRSTQWQSRRNASILTDNQVITRPADSGAKWLRIGSTAAVILGGAGAISIFNNRETRDSLTTFESNFLNATFSYVGAGLGITAASAYALHRTGASYRIMRANPWLVMGVSLVGTVGSMFAVFSTPPEQTGAKHFWWTAFNVAQSATLSPLFFFSPALLARAGLYTAGVVGSLAYVGATAKSDKYLYIGGPLFAGLCVVALSSLAPMILPVGTAALAVTQGVSLYGGLAVFGGFVLFDTQKILERARLAETGAVKADAVAESIRFELDVVNIFIRIVQILGMQQGRKK